MPWLRIWFSGPLVDGCSGDDLPVYNSFANGTWPARVIHLLLKAELSPIPWFGCYYSVNDGV